MQNLVGPSQENRSLLLPKAPGWLLWLPYPRPCGVVGQPEFFRRELLIWLLETYALERVLLVRGAIRLLLDEGLKGDAPGALALSCIRCRAVEAGAPKAPVVVLPKGVLEVVLPKGFDVVVVPDPKPGLFSKQAAARILGAKGGGRRRGS